MLRKFMQQLGKELEIEDFSESEKTGSYLFPVNEEISVSITEIPNGFSLSSTFGQCPEAGEEEFYTQTLLANLYGQGTQGAVLGLESEGKALSLSLNVDYSIDYKEFKYILEDFLNMVEFWSEEVKAYTNSKS